MRVCLLRSYKGLKHENERRATQTLTRLLRSYKGLKLFVSSTQPNDALLRVYYVPIRD